MARPPCTMAEKLIVGVLTHTAMTKREIVAAVGRRTGEQTKIVDLTAVLGAMRDDGLISQCASTYKLPDRPRKPRTTNRSFDLVMCRGHDESCAPEGSRRRTIAANQVSRRASGAAPRPPKRRPPAVLVPLKNLLLATSTKKPKSYQYGTTFPFYVPNT